MVSDPTAVPLLPAPPAPALRVAWPVWGWAVLILVASSGVWLAWSTQQRVAQLEAELVRRQQDSQTQAQEAHLLAKQAQDMAREAAARSSLIDTRLSDMSLQRGQLDDLIKTMTRSRDENLVVDIEASLRAAMQQATLAGSAEPLVAALQTADERLARAPQPRLDLVRRAIAKDLDRVKSTRVADFATLAIRLDQAIRLVDELPLVSDPFASVASATVSPATSTFASPSPGDSRSAPASAPGAAAQSEEGWSERLLHWTRRAGQTMWSETRALIRVTPIGHPDAMLISPDQAFFLRENLKLRLLNARLGLLSHQTGAATADLVLAQQAVSRYFDPKARRVQALNSLLKDIAGQGPLTQLPRPDDTLASLAALNGGR